MKIEEMYRLVDGTQANPGDCEKGEDGVLRNKNGMKVAVDSAGKPETIAQQAETNAMAAKAGKPEAAAPAAEAAPKADEPMPAVDPVPVDPARVDPAPPADPAPLDPPPSSGTMPPAPFMEPKPEPIREEEKKPSDPT